MSISKDEEEALTAFMEATTVSLEKIWDKIVSLENRIDSVSDTAQHSQMCGPTPVGGINGGMPLGGGVGYANKAGVISCAHEQCTSCGGTGQRYDGLGACVHALSCSCPKCSIRC